jgi:hypothetical protein
MEEVRGDGDVTRGGKASRHLLHPVIDARPCPVLRYDDGGVRAYAVREAQVRPHRLSVYGYGQPLRCHLSRPPVPVLLWQRVAGVAARRWRPGRQCSCPRENPRGREAAPDPTQARLYPHTSNAPLLRSGSGWPV